jgi:hypothetical protein
MPFGKPAIAECADCGAAICADCRTGCYGQSFCEVCGNYHVTHDCVREPMQSEDSPLPTHGSPLNQASLASLSSPRLIPPSLVGRVVENNIKK